MSKNRSLGNYQVSEYESTYEKINIISREYDSLGMLNHRQCDGMNKIPLP